MPYSPKTIRTNGYRRWSPYKKLIILGKNSIEIVISSGNPGQQISIYRTIMRSTDESITKYR